MGQINVTRPGDRGNSTATAGIVIMGLVALAVIGALVWFLAIGPGQTTPSGPASANPPAPQQQAPTNIEINPPPAPNININPPAQPAVPNVNPSAPAKP